MNLLQLEKYFHQRLKANYPDSEIENFFFWTLEEILGIQRIDFVLQKNNAVDYQNIDRIKKVIQRLRNEEPIQYIFGSTEFYGLLFNVSTDTLIPRPETEELVEWIIETVKQDEYLSSLSELRILDIGTGTGCIAITLTKLIPSANTTAVDISKNALTVAESNSALNEVNVHFVISNVLELSSLENEFDIIVSNPPYVRNSEKIEIKNNVLKYEPDTALFVEDNDPLLFYRKIGKLSLESLNPNGYLFFEINQYLGKEMVDLLSDLGYQHIELRKDVFGNDRMTRCQLS
ncbi:MAG: peptide chain release factor N(5)-glutamine methyltransferase [Polaribacter sp.]